MALGAFVAVLTTGYLIRQYGSRPVTIGASFAYCLALPGPVFAPSLLWLSLALFVFGVCLGTMDVAMNAQAASVEAACERPMMSGFHGVFSVGNVIGAAVAALFFAEQVSALIHIVAVMIVMFLVCAIAGVGLLPVQPDRSETAPQLGIPRGPLVGLSAFAFLMFVGEGALLDWTTVYLANDLGLKASVSVSGFAAFAGLMAVGRFAGDAVITAVGRTPVAIGSAALASVGLAGALFSKELLPAVAGFGVSGLGFANLIPILFGTAAKTTPDSPQTGIAGVAGVGYVGLVAGPPMIGFLAEAVGLRGARFAVSGAMAFVAIAVGPSLRRAGSASNGA